MEAGHEWQDASLQELIVHIVSCHHTFLRSHLPRIEMIFDRILAKRKDALCGFVLPLGRAFLGLRLDIEAHLDKEESILFPHIIRLAAARAKGKTPPQATFGSVTGPIRVMEAEHDSAKRALQEMRRLTDGYSLHSGTCSNRTELFQALKELEVDLEEHMALENDVLHPRVLQLEAQFGDR